MSAVVSQSLPVEGKLNAFFTHEQYVLTFTTTSVDVWRTAATHGHLDHVARLEQFVECTPYGLDPIIDKERNLIIIADRNYAQRPRIPRLLVFSLIDGTLVRRIELYGILGEKPLRYADGKMLVVIEDERNKACPCGLTSMLLCDAAGDGGTLSGITLPERLRAREQSRINTNGGILFPVRLMPNGNIIATSSEAYNRKMEVLRYRAADISNFLGPDASFELETLSENFERNHPTCSGLLDEDTVLIAVYEADDDQLPKGDACQTAIYAVDTKRMAVLWHSEYVGGTVKDVRYLASLDVVMAFGMHDDGTCQECDPFGFILALDPATGAQRRMETIRCRVQGGPVLFCGLAGDVEALTVVVICGDESAWVGDLRELVECESASGKWMHTVESLAGGRQVDEAEATGNTVILSVRKDSTHSSDVRTFGLV